MRRGALLVPVFAVAFSEACDPAPPGVRRDTQAIKALTTIHTAQVQYYSSYGRFATSLQELGPSASGPEGPSAAGLADRDLASGEKSSYKFAVQVTPRGYDSPPCRCNMEPAEERHFSQTKA